MFGVDFSEIALISLIALVVLGPAKLPQVVQTIGKWVGRARVMARQFREQLEQEANEIKRATDTRSNPPAPAAAATAAPAAAEPVAAAEPATASQVVGGPEASQPAVALPIGTTPSSATPASEPALHAMTFAHGAAGTDVWPPAPEPHDHPAPLPAEPHERGA